MTQLMNFFASCVATDLLSILLDRILFYFPFYKLIHTTSKKRMVSSNYKTQLAVTYPNHSLLLEIIMATSILQLLNRIRATQEVFLQPINQSIQTVYKLQTILVLLPIY